MKREKLVMFGGLALTLISTIAMIFWTWDRCPDPLVDFGREVYFPWRISEGQQLYRDLPYFNGPLTPYVHSIVFRVFGDSIDTLKGFNATVAIACALLVWHLVRVMGDDWSAAVAGVMFPVMFACQQVWDPTFNFLTAYSYDLTHGAALSLGMLACLHQATVSAKSLWWTIGAGALLGFVALTKAEVYLGAFASAAVFLVLTRRVQVVPFVIAFVAPIVLALLLLSLAMPFSTAFDGVLGSWKYLGNTELFSLKYFSWLRGTDDVGGNLLLVAAWLGAWIAVAGVAFIAAKVVEEPDPMTERVIAGVVALVLFVPPVVLWLRIPWPGALRPLPVIVAGALVILILQWRRASAEQRANLVLPLAYTVFAGLLMVKIVLNVHQFHYGFVLAMPAMMLMVVMLVCWLPRFVASKGGSGLIAGSAAAAALVALVLVHVRMNNAHMLPRKTVVAEGGNQFRAGIYGGVVEAIRKAIIDKTPPDSTLMCFPEGLLVNYLTKRVNPTGHAQFTPPALVMFGEQKMLDDLRKTPPDYIAIFEWDNSRYGPRSFGLDYGQSIAQWIASNYVEQGQVGDRPYTTGRPGVLLMRRRK